MSYQVIEKRITDAIDVLNTRENAKIKPIAREFNVPYDRLRNRLSDAPSKTAVRELHNRRLTDSQEVVLKLYYQKLSNADTSTRLNSIKNEADRLLRQDCDPANSPLSVESQWVKR